MGVIAEFDSATNEYSPNVRRFTCYRSEVSSVDHVTKSSHKVMAEYDNGSKEKKHTPDTLYRTIGRGFLRKSRPVGQCNGQ